MTDMTPLRTLLDQVWEHDRAAHGGTWYRYSCDFRGERSHSVKTRPVASVLAHTGYGPDGGMSSNNANLIAHYRTAAPQLAAVVEAVLRVHRPVGIYAHEDECENPDDEHWEERHYEYADMMGEFFCADLHEYTACRGCKEAADLDQWSGWWPQYPCPTVTAMVAVLKGDNDE